MKWISSKKQARVQSDARETLLSKTVLDDLLGQISGGAYATLQACHPVQLSFIGASAINPAVLATSAVALR